MKNFTLLILLVVFAIQSSGCATLLQNGPDNIPVHTRPEGAKVYLDDHYIGNTPLIASVSRKSEGIFRFEMEGYETVTIDKDKVLAGWFLGNIALLSALGLIIDLVASNQGKYSDAPITAVMKPVGAKDSRNPASVKAKRN